MRYCLGISSDLPMKIIKYSNVIPPILHFISRKLEGFGLFEWVFTTELLPSKMVRILCGFGLVTTASMTDYSVVVEPCRSGNSFIVA